MKLEADVAIVGAGVAGLSAARLLTRQGLHCCLLEAADVIGGRIRTVRRTGWQLPIELGAEFVHGRPTPTLALGGGAVGLVAVPEQRVMAGQPPRPMQDTWPRFARALEAARGAPAAESVAAYLERARLSASERQLVEMIVEGYHAAPLGDVSAAVVAEDAASGREEFRQYRTAKGYDDVLSLLEADISKPHGMVELGTRVKRISWSAGKVTLAAEGRHGALSVTAKRCLVTTSLGVLQTPPADGGILFEPLPDAFRSALPLLAMGSALRVVLRFEQAPPWLESEPGVEAAFIHVPGALFGTLWREARAGQLQITAWAGGPAARTASRVEPADLLTAAVEAVAQGTQSDVARCRSALVEAHCHDFNRDPLTRGAYSYVRPGGETAARTLSEPWENTLFFAGEALDLQYPGTVAGALGSGEHAARKLLTT
jgi:monoamine oxidase